MTYLFGYTQDEIRFILDLRRLLIKHNISMPEFMTSDAVKDIVIESKIKQIEALGDEVRGLKGEVNATNRKA